MPDRTAELSDILVSSYGVKPISSSEGDYVPVDEFLKEAYRINTHISSLLSYLHSIRPSYLSTTTPSKSQRKNRLHTPSSTTTTTSPLPQTPTHLTDPERDKIDTSTTTLLKDLSASISNLSAAESLRKNTQATLLARKYPAPKRANALFRWAAGDGDDAAAAASQAGKSVGQIEEEAREAVLSSVREGVLWFLNQGVREAGSLQEGMIRVRRERAVEKSKSVLYEMGIEGGDMNSFLPQTSTSTNTSSNMSVKSRARSMSTSTGNTSSTYTYTPYSPALDETSSQTQQNLTSPADDPELSHLSETQLQSFAQENTSLLQTHYNHTLAQITSASNSLSEISQLQSQLSQTLATQNESIEVMIDSVTETGGNVEKGNRQLKRAEGGVRTARWVFWGSVALCGFLVGWDFVI